MAQDTPNLYLDKLVKLLSNTRALGPVVRMRDGSLPFSKELDFRATDARAVRQTVAWAREQAPYAQIELVPGSDQAGTPTLFVRVDLLKLARFLAEHALMQATGQTWETATGALPGLVQRAIAETVGTGGAWQSLVVRLRVELASLTLFLRTVEADQLSGGIVAVIQEAIQQTVGQEASWGAFVDKLRSHVRTLTWIVQAIETGEYLLEG